MKINTKFFTIACLLLSAIFINCSSDGDNEQQNFNDTSLKELLINNTNYLDKINSSNVPEVTVDEGVTSVTIKAVPTDEKAEIVIHGKDNLRSGRNDVNITVITKSGVYKVYKIYVDVKKKADLGVIALQNNVPLNKVYDRFNNGATILDSIKVELKGGATSSKPIKVLYNKTSVTNTSTKFMAIVNRGTNVANTGKDGGYTVIPANKREAWIYFEVSPDNLNPGITQKFGIQLERSFDDNGNGIEVLRDTQFKEVNTNVSVVLCPFRLNRFLGAKKYYRSYAQSFVPGGGRPKYDFVIKKDESTKNGILLNEKSASMWYFAAEGIKRAYKEEDRNLKAVIDPVTKKITIPTQTFNSIDNLGRTNIVKIEQVGEGNVDLCSSRMTFYIKIERTREGTTTPKVLLKKGEIIILE